MIHVVVVLLVVAGMWRCCGCSRWIWIGGRPPPKTTTTANRIRNKLGRRRRRGANVVGSSTAATNRSSETMPDDDSEEADEPEKEEEEEEEEAEIEGDWSWLRWCCIALWCPCYVCGKCARRMLQCTCCLGIVLMLLVLAGSVARLAAERNGSHESLAEIWNATIARKLAQRMNKEL